MALIWFFSLGVLNFLGGRTSSYQAIGRIGASRTAAIQSTAAVFAAVFAITITGERPHFVVLLGTLIVVLGWLSIPIILLLYYVISYFALTYKMN